MPARVPQEEWDRRAAAQRLEWRGPVVKALIPAPVRCLGCDREWETLPNSVQQGHGCPICRRKTKHSGRHVAPQSVRDAEAEKMGLAWTEKVGPGSRNYSARCLDPACGWHGKRRPDAVKAGRQWCPQCKAKKPTPRCRGGCGAAVSTKRAKCDACWSKPMLDAGWDVIEVVPMRGGRRARVRCSDCGEPGGGVTGQAAARTLNAGEPYRCDACSTKHARTVPLAERHRQAAACNIRWVGDPAEAARNLTGCEAVCLDPECGATIFPHPSTVAMRAKQGDPVCKACGIDRRADALAVSPEERHGRAREQGVRFLDEPVRDATMVRAQCLDDECSHQWVVRAGHVVAGHGCPECSARVFSDKLPGRLYLVENPDEGQVKVGKTNDADRRLADHRQDGFTNVLWISDECLGALISDAERDALGAMRARGLKPVRGREYFALSRTFLVADAVSVARQAFDEATRQAKAA